MQTFAPPLVYNALEAIMGYYPDNFSAEAKIEVETLLDHCIKDLENSSEKFLTTLIIKALKKLIGPTGIDEHIYLKRYEISQIELFNVLIKEFPFVKWGHEIANTIIFEKLNGVSSVVIVDVGIGQGIQVKHLLEKLDKNKDLKKVVVIGIDPFNDALKVASKEIEEVAKKVSFEVEFVPYNAFIQKIDAKTLNKLVGDYDGEVIINACLALHHIQLLEERLTVISNLRLLNPLGFILIEPNIDHFEPNFYRRFQNCYQHFYHVFKVIDNLSVDEKSKNGLKLFFGREIEDILGKSNEERYEKHEPAFRWIEKLISCGFVVRNNFIDNLPSINNGIKLEFSDEGFLGFTYDSETVISMIYAESLPRY